MDAKDYLRNKSFCPMPWTGLMYNFDGSIKNCIRSNGILGNIKDNKVHTILSSELNVETQTNMLASIPGKECFPCYDLEEGQNGYDFNVISDRIFYLRELKSVSLDTYNTIGNYDLHTIDVRWSNVCNFGCVYCSPEFSSKWASELGIDFITPNKNQKADFKEYIFENAHQLKHVYLAGGEPLLMKDNLELLNLLKDVNPDVNLRINTNLSDIDTKIFKLVCKFKNVHWTVSVETTKHEYEYIRYGGTWEAFLYNLNIIQNLDHKISFNMLHFLLNYNSIFQCVDFFKEIGYHNNSFIIGPLLGPAHLNILNLPNNMLDTVKTELIHRINDDPGFLLEESYKNMLRYLDTPFDKDLENSFNELAILDKRRGLNSKLIFKKLYQNT